MSAVEWSVVVPVKRLATAKTRLAVSAALRRDLALAMALDTVTAAIGCPAVSRVVVVTDEDPLLFATLGALVAVDEPAAGLNAAVEHGAAGVAGGGLVALAADLPAFRGTDLLAVFEAVPPRGRGLVADAGGDGTTLLAAAPGVALRPAFGADSRRRHIADGVADLTRAAAAGLRRDVDTVADLAAAARLGVGARTAELLALLEPAVQLP